MFGKLRVGQEELGGCRRSRTIDVGGKWRGSFLFENGRSDEVGCKVVSEECGG